jgi:ABC-type multidrug transport system ATPase subunit
VDLFFATLTVREHLKFHAMVRVGKQVSVPDRLKRVEEVRGV